MGRVLENEPRGRGLAPDENDLLRLLCVETMMEFVGALGDIGDVGDRIMEMAASMEESDIYASMLEME